MNSLMDIVPGDSYPALCDTVGLSCETCVTDSATHLASVCKGLRGPMVTQMFVQIYTESACSPMSQQFAASYRRASVVAVTEMPRPLAPVPATTGHVSEDTVFPQSQAAVA